MGNFPYPSAYITNGHGELPAFPVRAACAHLAADGDSVTDEELLDGEGEHEASAVTEGARARHKHTTHSQGRPTRMCNHLPSSMLVDLGCTYCPRDPVRPSCKRLGAESAEEGFPRISLQSVYNPVFRLLAI